MKNKAVTILRIVSDTLARQGILYRDAETTELLKTFNGYRNALRRLVYGYYNDRIDEFDFVGRVSELIRDQLSRAYREGLRSAGFDPKNMTGAMQMELDGIIDSEEGYALDFIQFIEEQKQKDPRPPSTVFNPRIELRAYRYNDVVNMGALAASKNDDRLVWRLGATEEHCSTCAALDGKIATKEQWVASGYRPQNPPNALLECGGWRCDCSLEPTKDEATAEGIISV